MSPPRFVRSLRTSFLPHRRTLPLLVILQPPRQRRTKQTTRAEKKRENRNLALPWGPVVSMSSISSVGSSHVMGADAFAGQVDAADAIAAAPSSAPSRALPPVDATAAAESAASQIVNMRTSLAMQEKIIVALEDDNRKLRAENKSLLTKLKLVTTAAQPKPSHDPPPPLRTEPPPPTFAATAAATKRNPTDGNPMTSLAAYLPPDFDSALLEVKELRERIRRMEQEHNDSLKDCARKVTWYVEHHEQARAQDALVVDLQDQIKDLRIRLMDAESVTPATAARTPRSQGGPVVLSDKDRQIRALHRRVVDLEESLRSRNPDSVSELIKACRPPLHEQRAFKELEEKLAAVTKELGERDGAAQHTINQLRVETDALKAHYAQKLERIEEEMRLRLQSAQTRKVKELEKTLAETRRYYTERVKDLETQVLALRRGAPIAGHGKANSGQGHHPHHHIAAANDVPFTPREGGEWEGATALPDGPPMRRGAATDDYVSRKEDKETSRRTTGLNESSADAAGGAEGGPVAAPRLEELLRDNASLKRELAATKAYIAATSAARQPSSVAPSAAEPPTAHAASRHVADNTSQAPPPPELHHPRLLMQIAEYQQEIVFLNRTLRDAQDAMRRQQSETEDEARQLRSQHQRSIERLKREYQAEVDEAKWTAMQEVHRLAMANQREQLVASAAQNGGDEAKYLRSLTRQVQALESEHAEAIAAYRRQLDDAKRFATMELQREQHRSELAIAQKNTELEACRAELHSLLQDVARLTGTRGGTAPGRPACEHDDRRK